MSVYEPVFTFISMQKSCEYPSQLVYGWDGKYCGQVHKVTQVEGSSEPNKSEPSCAGDWARAQAWARARVRKLSDFSSDLS